MISFGKKILNAAGLAGTKVPGARRVIGSRPARWAGRAGAKRGRNVVRRAAATKTGTKVLGRSNEASLFLARNRMYPTGDAAEATRAAVRLERAAPRRVKPDFFPGISAMSPKTKQKVGMGALAAVGAYGFASGFSKDDQVSNSVYNLAFNNPNYDEYVMGKKMGVRSLLAPLPGEINMRSFSPTTYADAWRANRKRNPKVDGSIAFGMYNSRLG